jgi:hypothetical protein
MAILDDQMYCQIFWNILYYTSNLVEFFGIRALTKIAKKILGFARAYRRQKKVQKIPLDFTFKRKFIGLYL